jgi:hypothetical protein
VNRLSAIAIGAAVAGAVGYALELTYFGDNAAISPSARIPLSAVVAVLLLIALVAGFTAWTNRPRRRSLVSGWNGVTLVALALGGGLMLGMAHSRYIDDSPYSPTWYDVLHYLDLAALLLGLAVLLLAAVSRFRGRKAGV